MLGIPIHRRVMSALSALLVLLCSAGISSGKKVATTPYKVVSLTAQEIVLEIKPEYVFEKVADERTGVALTRIGVVGGEDRNALVGGPSVEQIVIPFLAPSRAVAKAEILEEGFDAGESVHLAPVPSVTWEGKLREQNFHYVADPRQYSNYQTPPVIRVESSGIYRTAYAQQLVVSPLQYDGASHSVRKATRLLVRITFGPVAASGQNISLPQAEREFFQSGFVNGAIPELYRSAAREVTAKFSNGPFGSANKAVSPMQAGSGGEWLQIETKEEGVYRISAQALKDAGIGGDVDPSKIQLFGIGGDMLNEDPTASSGEWNECAIDVRTNGNQLRDILFYAPGTTTWRTSNRTVPISALHHRINPYSGTGHFLLKTSGEAIGVPKRILFAPDTMLFAPIVTDRVFSGTVHEQERVFELSTVSREFLGETVPRTGNGVLDFELDAPGYTGDSTFFRVGFNSSALGPHGVSLSVNGQAIGVAPGYNRINKDSHNRRSWESLFGIPTTQSTPLRLSLSFTSSELDAQGWLNWIELFYRRSTSIGNLSIPFMVIGSKNAFEYQFTNGQGGAVWEVTKSESPRLLGSDAGNGSFAVGVQSLNNGLRKFIAYSEQSLRTPTLSKIAEPTLRNTIGQTGVMDIIIAPRAFQKSAEALRDLRRKGGEATEPMTAAVVYVEDIYREFGYGSLDVAAIRDFLAYTFRHAAERPLFATLFGAAHSDYQNRRTDVPLRVPAFEVDDSDDPDRTNIFEIYPDEQFFVRLTDDQDPDMGVGRLTVQTEEQAEIVVDKLTHYEHGSAQGGWRSLTSFIADDRDKEGMFDSGLDHVGDSEDEIKQLTDRLLVDKVYTVNYQTVVTSHGRKKPEAEKAVINAFNDGAVLISYVGHGNPDVWAHEDVLVVPGTINRLNNYDKLAFVTTATCDFSAFDSYDKVSGGSLLLLRPNGGAVGLLGTSRSVTGREGLVTDFFNALFQVPCESSYGTAHLGTALQHAKKGRSYWNAVHFFLLGDPAMRLLVPRMYATVDSINGKAVDASVTTMPALSQVKISGHVANSCEGSVVQDFEGNATITLYDAKTSVTRVSTFINNPPYTDVFDIEGPILYKGAVTVKGGYFTSTFILPKDIKYDPKSAKLSILAYAKDGRAALGALDSNITLVAPDSLAALSAAKDTAGPSLDVFIGTRRFHSGDVVAINSPIIVDVTDLHGLNTSTASIGHSFSAWVDDDVENVYDLSENYEATQDDFKSGSSFVRVQLPVGKHVLHVRAFDAMNNPSYAEVEFNAKDESTYRIYSAITTPNPMIDHTTFSFVQPSGLGNEVDVTISIFTTDGRHVRDIIDGNVSQSQVEILWDGLNDFGNPVAAGAYIYRINSVDRFTGQTATMQGRLIVTR